MGIEKEEVQWYHRPWVVVLLLFFVLGPFGLPLLYKSSQFNKGWKGGLTILTILYTSYLIWATLKAVESISSSTAQLQAILTLTIIIYFYKSSIS